MADIIIHFTLVGDNFDTSLVTKRTGIEPMWLREKDEVLGNGRLFGHTEWGIKTRMYTTCDILPVIKELSSVLTCSPKVLRDLAYQCNAEWNLLVQMDIRDNKSPAVYFPAEFIKFCGEIEATIGLDMSILV